MIKNKDVEKLVKDELTRLQAQILITESTISALKNLIISGTDATTISEKQKQLESSIIINKKIEEEIQKLLTSK